MKEFSDRPLTFLTKEAKKYLELAKQDLTLEQRMEYIKIIETLLLQADTYMNAIKEIQISPILGRPINNLKWKIYKLLFGDPYVTIKTKFLHRNGIYTFSNQFNFLLEKDTLTYKINATDEEVWEFEN